MHSHFVSQSVTVDSGRGRRSRTSTPTNNIDSDYEEGTPTKKAKTKRQVNSVVTSYCVMYTYTCTYIQTYTCTSTPTNNIDSDFEVRRKPRDTCNLQLSYLQRIVA